MIKISNFEFMFAIRSSKLTRNIRRGLRALRDYEFSMPSNTIGIARMRRELSTDVAETVLPQKEKKF